MRTVRALGSATSQLSRSFERLSSGLRIVHPADDAAGLAIGTSLGLDTRVFNRARLNINDANSALQIADGASGEIANLLTRMSELAEQAANGTIGFSQRKRLDDEYQQLGLEVRRIANTTTFNGRELMTGQRVNRSVTTVANTNNPYMNGITGDGSKVYYQDSITGQLNQYDTTTGQTTIIDNSAGLQSGHLSVTSSGDVLYFKNNRLTRFNAHSNTKEDLGLVTSDFNGATVSADGRTLLYTEFSVTNSAYLYDIETRTKRTIFSGSTSGAFRLQLSADGSKALFQSTANLNGQNPTLAENLYRVDLSATTVAPIIVTNFTGGFSAMDGAIANDGTVYLQTSRNLNGGDSATSTFIYKIASTGNATTLASMSASTLNYTGLTLGADDKTLSFLSTDRWAGENTYGLEQIFRYDLEGGNIRQLSQASDGRFSDIGRVQFSGDGNRIYFENGVADTVFTSDISMGEDSVSMEVGQGNRGGIAVALGAINGSLRGLGGMSLTSASAARGALIRTRENIQQLAKLRGVYGAAQSRLEVAHSVLTGQVLNGESARSQIMDADIAQEAANLVRTQILQRAASSLLAQANQQPALALQLLAR